MKILQQQLLLRYSEKVEFHFLAMFVFLLTLVQPGFSQSPVTGVTYPDSLREALKRSPADTSRVKTLFLLSDYYSDKDTSLALRYVNQAAGYSKKDSYQAALAHFYRAGVFFDTDMQKSETGYLTAEKLLRHFPGKEALIYRSRAWANYGALQQRQDNEKMYAQVLIEHSIPLAIQAGDSARIARNYQNLGIIFSNQIDYPKAEKYFKLAISILERMGARSLELVDSYIFGAKNYLYLKDYPPVKPMLDSAQAILASDPESPYFTDLYLVEGMYYSRLRQFSKAFESFDKGLAVSKKLNRPYDTQSIMLQKYFTHKAMENYPKALEVIKQVVAQEEIYPRRKNRMLYYYELAQTSAKVGDMKGAYNWLHQYAVLADSASEERIKSDIAALEARYQSTEKEKQIYQLQAKNEKAILTIKNNRLVNWLLAVVCLFLLAVTVLVLLFYRNNKRLWTQQKQLHDLELQKIKQDHRISMLSAMLEGQEQERTRLARDLHDGLGGLLSSIKIELSQVAGQPNQQMKVGIDRTLSHLDDAVNELRRIARSLMPEILMKYGLAEATREFCKNLKETGVNLICQVFNYTDSLPQEKQVVLYRIIQELVNNAVKHAAADQILVIIQQSGDTLFVTVEDDGKGFDTSKPNSKTGAGLSNVKARADFLNATFDIQSSPGNGTSVTVECKI
ncbi:ATP-binding protein [Dyadobacter sp. CY312]|uniref:ATP-binding protein n=1 Tax=Dyadobacter sp. CY312 TaxID=2907303 RepID=UPI001F30C31C|nr:ATP-binding protein [Dyadobacter sp. CY312]MCE7042686.1 sensor histidine kinase [Dyadobacter sp. CY312]